MAKPAPARCPDSQATRKSRMAGPGLVGAGNSPKHSTPGTRRAGADGWPPADDVPIQVVSCSANRHSGSSRNPGRFGAPPMDSCPMTLKLAFDWVGICGTVIPFELEVVQITSTSTAHWPKCPYAQRIRDPYGTGNERVSCASVYPLAGICRVASNLGLMKSPFNGLK